jgi:hypothetical protein
MSHIVDLIHLSSLETGVGDLLLHCSDKGTEAVATAVK